MKVNWYVTSAPVPTFATKIDVTASKIDVKKESNGVQTDVNKLNKFKKTPPF